MALNSFQFIGGANIAVSATPQAVQVTGPTVLITNIGLDTCYGSLGGSGSTTLSPGPPYISGQSVGGTGGGNTVGSDGIAIPPGAAVPLAVGANGWLWLCTLGGNRQTAVNVANGT